MPSSTTSSSAGLGGEAGYEEQFAKDADALAAVARRTTAASRVMLLQGEGATRDALVSSLDSLRTRAKAADSVVVMLVGHGSYDGEAYKLNLPGSRHRRRRVRQVARRSARALAARRQCDERQRCRAREVGRRRPDADHGDAQRLRAQRDALRAALRGGARRRLRRHQQERRDHGARGVRLRLAQRGRQLREGRRARDRAPADRGRRGGPLHGRAAGLGRPGRRAVGGESGRRAARSPSASGSTREIEALRARRESMASDAYLAELQKLLVQLAEVQGKIDAAQPRPPQ